MLVLIVFTIVEMYDRECVLTKIEIDVRYGNETVNRTTVVSSIILIT